MASFYNKGDSLGSHSGSQKYFTAYGPFSHNTISQMTFSLVGRMKGTLGTNVINLFMYVRYEFL
jgi:hypothetical protein